jgi:hypothetical protein
MTALNLLILLTFEILADCQHFYGGSIGRHDSSMEPLEPPWRNPCRIMPLELVATADVTQHLHRLTSFRKRGRCNPCLAFA